MRNWLLLVVMLLATVSAGLLPAAALQEDGEEQEQAVEWTAKFDARFLPRKPTIGDPAPQVGGFDEDGYLFDLVGTRGKYTVLVFGCLT